MNRLKNWGLIKALRMYKESTLYHYRMDHGFVLNVETITNLIYGYAVAAVETLNN